MTLNYATELANELIEAMQPFCERVEIAGSIRRGKPEVKDIEIVAIPKYDVIPAGLFGEEDRTNALHKWAMEAANAAGVIWIKTGTHEIIPWTPKADGKWWKGHLPEHGIKLDLFLCGTRNWGAIQLIRTGSGQFSQAIMTHAQYADTPCQGGYFRRDGQAVPTPEEKDVFELLGLEYVEPAARIDGRAIRRVGA